MKRIEKIWKDKALIAVRPGLAPSQEEGQYLHESQKELILSVAKALRVEFERGQKL